MRYLVLAFVPVLAVFLVMMVASSRAEAYSLISTQMDVGARGADVSSLQAFLATSPSVYPEGLVTGYYGPLTQRAVTQFQIGYGLPAVGRVGPLTMAKINSLISGGQAVDVSGPMITGYNISRSGTSATISWQTNEPAQARVHYDTLPISSTEASASKIEPFISGTVASDGTLSTTKSISLSNLSAGASYNFMVEAIDSSGNVSVKL